MQFVNTIVIPNKKSQIQTVTLKVTLQICFSSLTATLTNNFNFTMGAAYRSREDFRRDIQPHY